MLYQNDLIFNFLLITLIAKTRLVYYDFDFKTRAYSAPKRWQQWGFVVTNALAMPRIAITVLSAVREYLYPSEKLYHTLCAYGFPAVILFVLAIHILTNMAHRNYCEFLTTTFQSLPKGRRSLKSMKSLKLMELTIIFLPNLVLTSGPFMTLGSYFIDYENPIFLLSWIPREYWNIRTILVCAFIDVFAVGVLIVTVYNFLIFGIIFMVFMNKRLDETMKTLRMIDNLEGNLLRRLRLTDMLASQINMLCMRLRIFNATGKYVVYLAKQMTLFISILTLYACIVYFDSYPLIAAISACFCFPCVLFYVLLFDQAFGFPDKMDDIKRAYNLQACRIPIPRRRKYHQARVAAIHFKGIEVGDFQVMERQSTPNFIDYIVSEVTSLLVGNSSV